MRGASPWHRGKTVPYRQTAAKRVAHSDPSRHLPSGALRTGGKRDPVHRERNITSIIILFETIWEA